MRTYRAVRFTLLRPFSTFSDLRLDLYALWHLLQFPHQRSSPSSNFNEIDSSRRSIRLSLAAIYAILGHGTYQSQEIFTSGFQLIRTPFFLFYFLGFL